MPDTISNPVQLQTDGVIIPAPAPEQDIAPDTVTEPHLPPVAAGTEQGISGAVAVIPHEKTCRELLVEALEAHNGNRSRAAKQLGWCRRKVIRYIKKYKIDVKPTGKGVRKINVETLTVIPPQPVKPTSIYSQDEYIRKIEQDGVLATQSLDLENEIILLRAYTIELLGKFRKGTATGGHSKNGEVHEATDTAKADAIVKLTKAIAAVRKEDHGIRGDKIITIPAFKMWLAKFTDEIKKEFPDIKDIEKFGKASRRAGEPESGGGK